MYLKGLIVLFQKMVHFIEFSATVLEILALELQAFCEIFAVSAHFVIFYLISIWNDSKTKQEK